MMYELIKPILLRLDPELAHDISLRALNITDQVGILKPNIASTATSSVTVMGLTFRNPVGLAAGLDKNGDFINCLTNLGFGFIEIGTVTPLAQPGNDKPRLFRLKHEESLINRMGFNNKGLEHLLNRVKKNSSDIILGINIGKNKHTPLHLANDDYVLGLERSYAHASYVAINISSPNTEQLRDLQSKDNLRELLVAIKDSRTRLEDVHGFRKPIALKIAPDLDSDQIKHIADLVFEHQIDAIIATNTTISRPTSDAYAVRETGGLSGRLLQDLSTNIVYQLHEITNGEIPIIGVGGILDAKDAANKIQAGASLVQIYTGLIYRGPRLIRECVSEIARLRSTS
jgi:dihydroorotate dehydrogenase